MTQSVDVIVYDELIAYLDKGPFLSSPFIDPNSGLNYVLNLKLPKTVQDELYDNIKYEIQSSEPDKGICYTCNYNISKYSSMFGPFGPIVFEGMGDTHPCECSQLRNIRKIIENVHHEYSNCDCTIIPISIKTFRSATESLEGDKLFRHLTVKIRYFPSAFASNSAYNKMMPLINKYENSGLIRMFLEQYLTFEMRDFIMNFLPNIMERCQPERRAVYDEMMLWMKTIYDYHSIHWSQMTEAKKARVVVFALSIGNSNVSVHSTFHQANKYLPDITDDRDENRIIKLINTRANPLTYQVSQYTKKLNKLKVTSRWTIGLLWDGQDYPDDLDLHVINPDNTRTYWMKKENRQSRLNFGAGINGNEVSPSENITCYFPGCYRILVNNFKRRTYDQDIHFTVIIREYGNIVMTYDSFWGKFRLKDDYLEIAEWTFPSKNILVPEMTEKDAKKTIQISDEW